MNILLILVTAIASLYSVYYFRLWLVICRIPFEPFDRRIPYVPAGEAEFMSLSPVPFDQAFEKVISKVVVPYGERLLYKIDRSNGYDLHGMFLMWLYGLPILCVKNRTFIFRITNEPSNPSLKQIPIFQSHFCW